MKSLRTYLIALLSLLLIGAGVLAWTQYTELTDLRGKLLDSNGSDLKKQLADARKQIKDLQDKLTALRNKRGGKGGDLADDNGPDGDTNGQRANRRDRGPFGGPWGELMNRPDVQKLMALQQKANLDARYAALFKNLNLTPEQLDQFKSLLVQKQQAMMDAVQAARESGINPREDPAAFKAAITQAQATVDQQIQATLGDAGFAQYQQYQQTLPERNTATQLQTALSYTQTPLTDDQLTQMIGILQQTQPTKSGSGTGGTGGGGPGGMGALMNGGGQSNVTADTLTLASGVLSAPQQAALQQIQQQQQAQQQMQQLMRQQRQASQAASGTAAAGK